MLSSYITYKARSFLSVIAPKGEGKKQDTTQQRAKQAMKQRIIMVFSK